MQDWEATIGGTVQIKKGSSSTRLYTSSNVVARIVYGRKKASYSAGLQPVTVGSHFRSWISDMPLGAPSLFDAIRRSLTFCSTVMGVYLLN